ncbi:MAG: GNAT family protein [Actinomycetota bacterium]|nr:GNAT family protein [Actinomycetota bacterium]
MSENWPVHLKSGELILKPLRWRDRNCWLNLRNENRDWLTEWEATLPQVPGEIESNKLPTFVEMVSWHRREGRQGRSYSLAIWHINGQGKNLIGQITMGGVMYGAMRGAHIGYWIGRAYANRGFITQAVQAVTDFGFSALKLHRIEINIRPENLPSIRVAEKAGYLFEGVRPRYLHIDGSWRDHVCYVKENSEVI